ncbi:uncharacterized protein G2W53_000366 [Senna tora]|uniref:Uncharacterized protein n=1 Tax=Senna tora TaxID=362788 RepID=A0A835CHL4_9FABA|nr:uncharacterized protein G2W53_000366 [Senna tora]
MRNEAIEVDDGFNESEGSGIKFST